MADFWDELNGGREGLPPAPAMTDQRQAPDGPPPIPTASGYDFGAIPAAYAPPGGDVATLANRYSAPDDYVAPQFGEAAPTFTAPTDVTMQNDPGYLFRINQVRQQGERMAAAKGSVLNAGTVAAINDRVGDQASSEFGNVFGRAATTFDKALATYGAKYNVFQGNANLVFQADQANSASGFQADRANKASAQQGITNAQNTYGINATVTKSAQDDYWSRLMDQARLGASSAAA